MEDGLRRGEKKEGDARLRGFYKNRGEEE